MAKISSLQKGLIFHMPLTDKYLQTATLPSDISASHNHASSIVGAPSYSSAGMELNGVTEGVNAGPILDGQIRTVALKFNPDDAADVDDDQYLYNSPTHSYVWKRRNEYDNALRIAHGNYLIANLDEEEYAPYWHAGAENTLIMEYVTQASNVWMNGTLIVDNSSQGFGLTGGTDDVHIGTRFGAPGQAFDGHIRDFAVWDRVLTAAERYQYENSSAL